MYYKVRQVFILKQSTFVYYKVGEVVLQSMTANTKWPKFIAKCGRHYKVEQYLHHIVC